jgi:hypothetical protein
MIVFMTAGVTTRRLSPRRVSLGYNCNVRGADREVIVYPNTGQGVSGREDGES